MKKWLQFIFSRHFIQSVWRLGLVWVMIVGAVWIWLRVYTDPGATQELPDVRGLTFSEAQEALQELGVSPIHLDSIYNRKGRPFEVIDQVPPPGSKIKSGRRVYLTTYRGTPPFEQIGIQEGQDPGIARIMLENRGFEVVELTEPNLTLVGRVVRVENAKGNLLRPTDRLPRGTVIHIISGTTTNEQVAVPNLMSLTLEEARQVLLEARLSLGLVEYSSSVESAADSLIARVIQQHLPPTSSPSVAAGTELDLYLGLRWEQRRD